MAEWSIAAVLKTVELRGSGGSNPSLSAINLDNQLVTRIVHEKVHESIQNWLLFLYLYPKRSPTWEKPDFNIVPEKIRASQQCKTKV